MSLGWRDRIVVVGTGPAGMAAADELRRLGFAGELTVLGDEPLYDRPACSKGVLSGHQKPADVRLPASEAPMDLRLGRRAAVLDPFAHLVCTDDGEVFEYDGLVLATGAAPVVPPGWPVGEPGLHTLHTLSDAWTVRQELYRAERVADLVLVTAGERPDTGWLSGSGLDISDGVLCDASLRVRQAEAIVAAGVVARWPNLRFGTANVRCGQWIGAMEQGRAAAATLLAGDRPAPPVTLLPRFWSQQGDLRIQACGDLNPGADVALTRLRPGRSDAARSGLLAMFYRAGRLTGLVAVNSPRAFTSSTRALLHEVPPDVVPETPIYERGNDAPAPAHAYN